MWGLRVCARLLCSGYYLPLTLYDSSPSISFSSTLSAHSVMDSPAVPVPLDPREQPILERLLRTRDALLLLKQDKSSYIKSRDVLPLYEEVTQEVEKLNAARKEQDRRLIHNRREYRVSRGMITLD